MTNPIAALLVELALKSTVVLAVAFAAAALVRRLSAEERHVVWAVALAGLLALPLVSILGPKLGVPIRDIVASASFDAVAGWRSASADGQRSATPALDASAATPDARRGATEGGAAAPTSLAAGASSGGVQAPGAAKAGAAPIGAVVAAVYAAVAALVLAYFAAATIAVAIALRKLPAVTDASILARLEEARRRFGLRRAVRVKFSRRDSTPWAWGVLRPVVVLPDDFAQLPQESQRDALAHELSHIARLDFVTTLLGGAACALYWFQPLAWLAFVRMARDSEHACDDRVLLSGGSRIAYASQLLDIARAMQNRRAVPRAATAMAASSAVSRRIASILDLDTRRRTMSKYKISTASILAGALIVPLASLESQEAPAPGASAPSDAELGALVQKGAASSDELELIVDGLLERGRQAEAVAALADYIARDAANDASADASCTYCGSILQSEAAASGSGSDAAPALLLAFDEVENRAHAAADGDLLIRLAGISVMGHGAGGWRGRAWDGRAVFYLTEGFRLGNLSDGSKLDGIRFLNELGWHHEAKDLAHQLHDDEASSLYRSAEVKRWIDRLESEIEQRTRIGQRLLMPNGSFSYKDSVVPLYREAPVYPPVALEQGVEGSVQLEFTISARGRPEGVTVVSSTNGLFDDAAVAAVSQWLYAPNVVDGTAVDAPGVQTVIRFVLSL